MPRPPDKVREFIAKQRLYYAGTPVIQQQDNLSQIIAARMDTAFVGHNGDAREKRLLVLQWIFQDDNIRSVNDLDLLNRSAVADWLGEHRFGHVSAITRHEILQIYSMAIRSPDDQMLPGFDDHNPSAWPADPGAEKN